MPKIMQQKLTDDSVEPNRKAWTAPHVQRLEPSEALLRKIQRHDPAFARAAREMIERKYALEPATGVIATAGTRRR